MAISELCNRHVVFARRDESVASAVQLMRSQHVGDVVVIDEDGQRRPVGMLTDRDIVIEIVAKGVDPEAVTVADVMSRELYTIGEEQDLFTAFKLMSDKGVRRLPVVNRDGGLEGLITVDDVIELLAELLSDITTLIAREQQQEHKLAD